MRYAVTVRRIAELPATGFIDIDFGLPNYGEAETLARLLARTDDAIATVVREKRGLDYGPVIWGRGPTKDFEK